MANKLHLTIPEPCSNRWSGMSFVNDTQRHCSSCEKIITDFTQMSDEELLAHFRDRPVSCGMFAPHQLDRMISAQKKKRPWLGAVLLPALFAFTEAGAQEQKPAAVIEQTADSSQPDVQVQPDDAHQTAKDTFLVSGSVVGLDFDTTQSPLAGAVVIFRFRDNRTYGCVADYDGKFQIKLPEAQPGDTVNVEVRYTGYERYQTAVTLKERETVLTLAPLQQMQTYTMGLIVETSPRSRVRSFFWRLVHPRYWFRR
jgi:hypothetical protein